MCLHRFVLKQRSLGLVGAEAGASAAGKQWHKFRKERGFHRVHPVGVRSFLVNFVLRRKRRRAIDKRRHKEKYFLRRSLST